jgi:hypothetical protein
MKRTIPALLAAIVLTALPLTAAADDYYSEDPLVMTADFAVLKSVNNSLPNAHYRPKLADLPKLAEQAARNALPVGGDRRSDTGYRPTEFGGVYAGYFDADYKAVERPPDRAVEVLGADILLGGEEYTPKDGYVPAEAWSVTLDYALMCAYKALGKAINRSVLFFTGYGELDNSPFVSRITTPVRAEARGRYSAAEVFTTRSNKADYWEKAVSDGVITGGESPGSPVTTGQFSLLVSKLAHLYGEPVLTDLESEYLLEVYGSELPYSLPAEQFDAVKYLLARGIALDSYNYFAPIDRDTLLDILMRLKDVQSRETFKTVQITAPPELLQKGYYPIELDTGEPGVKVLSEAEIVTYARPGSYDYFVKRVPGKTVYYANGAEEIPYVESKARSHTGTPLAGSEYLGIVSLNGSGWYRFRIPAALPPEALYGGCLTINTPVYEAALTAPGSGSRPSTVISLSAPVRLASAGYFEIQAGGGWYDCNGSSPYDRRDFSDADGAEFTDITRDKAYAQSADEVLPADPLSANIPTSQPLSLSRTLPFISLSAPASPQSGGTSQTLSLPSLSARSAALSRASALFKSSHTVTAEFDDPGRYTFDGIPLPKKLGGDVTITNDGNTYTFSGLKEKGELYDRLRMIPDSKIKPTAEGYAYERGVLLIDVNYFKENGAIAGWERLPNNQILLYAPHQNVYIDSDLHRIISGTTVYDTPPEIPLAYEKGEKLLVDYRAVTGWTRNDFRLLTCSGGRMTIARNDMRVKGENPLTYRQTTTSAGVPTDQWVTLYRDSKLLLNGSYSLANYFVYRDFRASASRSEDTLYSFGFGVQDDSTFERTFGVKIPEQYAVSSRILTQDSASGGVEYDPELGYLFTLSEEPGALIPLSIGGGKIIDANANRVTEDGEIEPAPVGVAAYLIPDYGSSPPPGSKFFYGTAPAESDGKTVTVNGKKLDAAAGKFRTLFIPSDLRGRVVSFVTARFEPLSEGTIKPRPAFGTGEPQSQPDWEHFNLEQTLVSLDASLSVGVYAALAFIPRVVTVMLILLIILSLITNFKPWRDFCTEHFDIYRFLTAGRQSVETINQYRMTFSLVAALAVLGLFQNGTVLAVIGAIVRSVIGILIR